MLTIFISMSVYARISGSKLSSAFDLYMIDTYAFSYAHIVWVVVLDGCRREFEKADC